MPKTTRKHAGREFVDLEIALASKKSNWLSEARKIYRALHLTRADLKAKLYELYRIKSSRRAQDRTVDEWLTLIRKAILARYS